MFKKIQRYQKYGTMQTGSSDDSESESLPSSSISDSDDDGTLFDQVKQAAKEASNPVLEHGLMQYASVLRDQEFEQSMEAPIRKKDRRIQGVLTEEELRQYQRRAKAQALGASKSARYRSSKPTQEEDVDDEDDAETEYSCSACPHESYFGLAAIAEHLESKSHARRVEALGRSLTAPKHEKSGHKSQSAKKTTTKTKNPRDRPEGVARKSNSKSKSKSKSSAMTKTKEKPL